MWPILSFYDRTTGLFFSGDFLLPGRLLIDDTQADISSADRDAGFVRHHPVTLVLGGHIEMDREGSLFSWGSEYHPNEHVLQMSRDDLLALPAVLRTFNGIYTVRGRFVMMNSQRGWGFSAQSSEPALQRTSMDPGRGWDQAGEDASSPGRTRLSAGRKSAELKSAPDARAARLPSPGRRSAGSGGS